MPKVVPDSELLRDVQTFVAREGGNCRAAARRLGVEPSTLWRFLKSGRATARLASELRTGLCGAAEAGVGGAEATRRGPSRPKRNVTQLRKALQYLLEALDAYDFHEASSSKIP